MSGQKNDAIYAATVAFAVATMRELGWIAPPPTEEEVLAAAKRAAAANSSMHEGCDLELFWSYLDERSQAHWLKVARAALGVDLS